MAFLILSYSGSYIPSEEKMLTNDLINWRVVFEKDNGAGDNGSSESQDDKNESEIDYTKLDVSKIPLDIVAKLPIDLLAKHPEYQKVKTSDEKHRKTNSDLRKQLESVDKDDSDKQDKADRSDNSGKENKNEQNSDIVEVKQMLAQILRKENLSEALKKLNVDDKGKEKIMLQEKHLRYIQGNTVEEMINSGKEVIQSFELDKKNLDSGAANNGSSERQPFGKIDIQGRIKRKINNEGNNPFDASLHAQKGGF